MDSIETATAWYVKACQLARNKKAVSVKAGAGTTCPPPLSLPTLTPHIDFYPILCYNLSQKMAHKMPERNACYEETVMRAVILSIFLSFFSLPTFASAEQPSTSGYLDAEGCVAYEDTPFCYKPSWLFENEDPMFQHWVIENVEEVDGVCTITFHPVTEADSAIDTLEESLAQHIFWGGRWMRWMDFDIEIWENGCKDKGFLV